MKDRTSDITDEKADLTFNGVDGLTCLEFIQAIRQRAFDEGKSRDDAWIADMVALRFSGPALRWFESLDDNTQRDWKLLRQAIVRQYAEPLYEEVISESAATKSPEVFAFEGKDREEVNRFINFVQKQALLADKVGDDKWMAQLASACYTGRALRWYSDLDAETRNSWRLMEQTLRSSVGAQPGEINAKRVGISHWSNMIHASSIGFPKTEEQWLAQGRARRAKMAFSKSWNVAWHLVEAGGTIPDNAIPTGHEYGGTLFCMRVWHNGGLTLGKHGRHHSVGFIPWWGNEITWYGPFEILVGEPAAVFWVAPRGGPFIAVEGGFENSDTAALFIARAEQDGSRQPGKAFSTEMHGYFSFWPTKEYGRHIDQMQILAWVA